MNRFVDFSKRSVELPPGCKDLIDVLRPVERRAVPSTIAIRYGQSLRRVSQNLCELLRPGTRPKNLVIGCGGTNYVQLTNRGQTLTVMAVVHEDTGRERSVREVFGAAGLAPISDEAMAGGAIRVLQCSLSVSAPISLSVSAPVVARLVTDLLRNGYGLAKSVKHEIGYWEEEGSSGKLTSIEKGPERNVTLIITPSEVRSEISEPPGSYDPQSIDHYELTGLQQSDQGLVTLTFVLANQCKVLFYSTHQKADMVLLLDQLDATIGERARVDPRQHA